MRYFAICQAGYGVAGKLRFAIWGLEQNCCVLMNGDQGCYTVHFSENFTDKQHEILSVALCNYPDSVTAALALSMVEGFQHESNMQRDARMFLPTSKLMSKSEEFLLDHVCSEAL